MHSMALEAIGQDLNGQITEAYNNPDWHQKWGRHYLLSLSRAHVLQQCTNFKDPGVQIYATQKFSLLRDQSEDIFCKLPPPTPSRPPMENYVLVNSMSRYYDRSTPCFARGKVQLVDGREVDITELRAGDVVESARGPVRVKCMVKTECEKGIEQLVELGDGTDCILVTPWHPVLEHGATNWSFPADLGVVKEHVCDAVYSFVLEDGACALPIGRYQGVALGHGIITDPVAEHAYLGTRSVLEDLAEMDGWEDGFITLVPKPCLRDPKTQLIVKMYQCS